MGTRSTTKVYGQWGDGDPRLLLSLYKQYDGYTESWGKTLKDFIRSQKFVNGIGKDRNVFNGAGCFAAQLVAKFKTESGDIYCTDAEDEQYRNYAIIIKDAGKPDFDGDRFEIRIECAERPQFNETIVSEFPMDEKHPHLKGRI